MSRLTQLKSLLCIEKHGSIAAASRELGISPAAISKQMTKLEEELGIQLLVRTTRMVTFTDIGKAYLEQAHRILEEVETSNALVLQMKAIPKGKLKVFCTPYFASRFVTPCIPEFLNQYPGIELELEIGERIPHFEGENIDLMVGNSMKAGDHLSHRRLLTTRYAICASPNYLKKNGTPITLNELCSHQILTHSMRHPDNLLYLKNKKEIPFKPYLKVNDAKTLIELALQGLGVVQLHHYTVKDHLQREHLQELFTNETRDDVPIYLVVPERRYTPSKVRAFIDFLQSRIEHK